MNTRHVSFDDEEIKRLLGKCIAETFPELPADKSGDLIFHMTDWLADLSRLCDLYSDPTKYGIDETKKILLAFLLHVPEHVSAAAEIFTGSGVEHIFRDSRS
jgi:hypothetical protein